MVIQQSKGIQIMGRPLNKRFFGNPTTKPGLQIKVSADLGSGKVPAWIVEQVGTRQFIVTDGTTTTRCFLVQNVTQPGEAVVRVYLSGGVVETARTIQARRVKTFEGSDVVWSFDPPANDKAQILGA
jgi:hypothetical protein